MQSCGAITQKAFVIASGEHWNTMPPMKYLIHLYLCLPFQFEETSAWLGAKRQQFLALMKHAQTIQFKL